MAVQPACILPYTPHWLLSNFRDLSMEALTWNSNFAATEGLHSVDALAQAMALPVHLPSEALRFASQLWAFAVNLPESAFLLEQLAETVKLSAMTCIFIMLAVNPDSTICSIASPCIAMYTVLPGESQAVLDIAHNIEPM